jgi:hypothetical protein
MLGGVTTFLEFSMMKHEATMIHIEQALYACLVTDPVLPDVIIQVD